MLVGRGIRRAAVSPVVVGRSATRGYAKTHHVEVIKSAAADFPVPKQRVLKHQESASLTSSKPTKPLPSPHPIRDVYKNVTPPLRLKSSVMDMLTPTMRKFTLEDKVTVVTGAARGLGYNMAQALSQSGAKAIAILDMRPELGADTATKLHEASKIPVNYYNVDIREESLVSAAVSHVVEDFGSVDVLVNSAGIAESNIRAESYTQEQFARTMDINVIGNFLVAQAVGRRMIQSGNGGSIIFIASMSGTVVNFPQEQSAYNASKAAVIQLTKSLAAEWAKYGIRVNSISPGYMDTDLNKVPTLDAQKKIWKQMTPQKRLGGVDELNNLAVFLASEASTFMTGSNILIDGGYSVY